MPFLRSLYSLWQRQTRFRQTGWIGLSLFLGYVVWHVLFVTDLVPGPYLLIAQAHQVFFLVFWCLLLTIVPVCFVFPVTTLRKIKHRWLKIIGLGVLGMVSTVVLIPALVMSSGISGLLLLLMLAIFFDIWWILVVVRRFPDRARLNSEIAFSGLLGLILLLVPVGGYVFESVDSFTVQEWGKSYHVSYMNFKAPGKLTLFECGPTRLFCRKIYHFCEYGGPSSDATLAWANDRLSLKFNDSVIYERYKTEDNRFVGDPISSAAYASGSHNGNCRASQWN